MANVLPSERSSVKACTKVAGLSSSVTGKPRALTPRSGLTVKKASAL